jgi:hypothetical protein
LLFAASQDVLGSDRDIIFRSLSAILNDANHDAAIRGRLSQGLHTLPTSMQSAVRDLLADPPLKPSQTPVVAIEWRPPRRVARLSGSARMNSVAQADHGVASTQEVVNMIVGVRAPSGRAVVRSTNTPRRSPAASRRASNNRWHAR